MQKATPNKWPLLVESGNRRVAPGEIGEILDIALCPQKCPEHDRITVKFSDGEIVIALRDYWNIQ